MSKRQTAAGALGALFVTMILSGTARPAARPPVAAVTVSASTPTSALKVAAGQAPRAHASLRLDVARSKAWVGEAVPVTITALFRDVEGVTLQGAVQLTSKAIMTLQVAKDPRQSTEVIAGAPVLVVTWSATVTPSAPGPLDLSVDLPVQIRVRDPAPAPEAEDPWGSDPFAGLDADPFDGSLFNQMRRRMMQVFEQPLAGRARQEERELKASSRPLDVQALPTVSQPAGFSGAVGRFDLKASLSTSQVHVSEPVTLRVEALGQGDLDRVTLPGVSTSENWKAYPPKVAIDEPASGKRPGRRVFEQVLVPLRSGALTIPAVSLVTFDPLAGSYVTRETSPLAISVQPDEGKTNEADVAPPTRTSAPLAPPIVPPPSRSWLRSLSARAVSVGARIVWGVLAGAIVTLIAGLGLRILVRRRRGRALQRSMRRAAVAGRADDFFGCARRLIAARLARAWGIDPEAVTSVAIAERMGPAGQPLMDVLAAHEALRFAHGAFDPVELGVTCASVEEALRSAA